MPEKKETKNRAEPEFIGIHSRLLYIQQNIRVPKERTNNERPDDTWRWRSAEDILEAVKPLLAKTGCTVTLSEQPMCIGTALYQVCTATLRDGDGDETSVSTSAREDWKEAYKCAAQISGSAVSYARKYALCGLFAIDGGSPALAEDPDNGTHAAMPSPEPEAAPAPAEPAAPAPQQSAEKGEDPRKPFPQKSSSGWKAGVINARRSGLDRKALREKLDTRYILTDEQFNEFATAAGL